MEAKLVMSIGEYDIYRTSPNRYSVYFSPTEANIASNLTFENALLLAKKLARSEIVSPAEEISPRVHGRISARDILRETPYFKERGGLSERERLLRGLPDIPVGIKIRKMV